MTASTSKKTATRIDLGNELNINKIENITKNFLQTTSKSNNIILSSKIIENIDLTGIQFLLFAQKISEEKGVKLIKEMSFSESSLELLNKTGFDKLIS